MIHGIQVLIAGLVFVAAGLLLLKLLQQPHDPFDQDE